MNLYLSFPNPHGRSDIKTINIPLSSNMSVLDDGVVEMSVEALLYIRHTLHLGNTSHRYLFTFVSWSYHLGARTNFVGVCLQTD